MRQNRAMEPVSREGSKVISRVYSPIMKAAGSGIRPRSSLRPGVGVAAAHELGVQAQVIEVVGVGQRHGDAAGSTNC